MRFNQICVFNVYPVNSTLILLNFVSLFFHYLLCYIIFLWGEGEYMNMYLHKREINVNFSWKKGLNYRNFSPAGTFCIVGTTYHLTCIALNRYRCEKNNFAAICMRNSIVKVLPKRFFFILEFLFQVLTDLPICTPSAILQLISYRKWLVM